VTPRLERLAQARLYLVAPIVLRAGRLSDLIEPLAEAGVDVFQLRDKHASREDLLAAGRACATAARRAGALLVVNDDPYLAAEVDADGVHLGQLDGSLVAARAVLGPGRIIGRTTRGGDALRAAHEEGADYASVGPVWETATHPTRSPVGLAPCAAARRSAPLPWFALGGVDERRIGRLAALGVPGVAVVRAIVDAADPIAVARSLRVRLDARPRVLTIAGSDSGGGAGIQADVKAISAAGGFPLCAITALTAQSTLGVHAVQAAGPTFVREQFDAVAADIGVDAVKCGMLGDAATVSATAAAIATLDPTDEVPVVVDPVMRAEAGSSLLADGGIDVYRSSLLPLATVITPNLHEAQALAGSTSDDAAALALALHATLGCAVIVTGGHGPTGDDVLCVAGEIIRIPGVRLPRATTHGAGCTHSSTLATLLARGETLVAAATGAKAVATAAVARGLPYGAGAGPVDVFGPPDGCGSRAWHGSRM
jgi:hydroxymethylpyrimidine kinase/phosphomethylpyrimidine kinase/thiamine-phosphate diphosphorylase